MLPTMLSISGLRLLCGTRASRISTTASTSDRFAAIIRRVFVICPGNHWIFRISSSAMPAAFPDGNTA
ncbi:MAG: hypothetical protein ACLR1R_02490 [Ruminococcus callidus]